MPGTEISPVTPSNAVAALSDLLSRCILLRGLLWCEPCDQPVVPTMLRRLSRHHACSGERCPNPALPAPDVERAIWDTFVLDIPEALRHAVLRRELTRVVIGADVTNLRLQWRDQPEGNTAYN